jgi:hypothetical protein
MARTTPTDLYWAKKVAASPSLNEAKGTKLTLTVASLEKEIRKAHKAGMAVGFRQGHEVGKLAKLTKDEINSLSRFFDQFTAEKP